MRALETCDRTGIRPFCVAGVLAIVALALMPGAVFAAAPPELPRLYVESSPVPSAGRTIAVSEGGDFQAALDGATPGDTITLAAGATFTGNFRLPSKSGSGWIVIRTSAPDGSLPRPGTRITPASAPALAKVVSPNSGAAIATEDGAHHYRLTGIEITVGAAVSSNNGLVQLGSGAQTTLAEVAHDIVLDRVYIHGNASVRLRRNVALNSAATAIVDSHLSDAHDPVYDTQAIAGWNGPGPFKIVNNYLEGSGENVMFGGADPTVPNLVPSDIEIRRNHFSKPLSWRAGDPSQAGTAWAVKNLLELKNAQRLLIDGNVFENNWVDAGNGFAILFTVRNQDGQAPWSVVQDVTFTNNIVRRAGGGIAMLGKDTNHPSAQMSRVLIRNNLFEDIDAARWGGLGRLFQVVNAAADVVIEHVTALQSGNLIGVDLDPSIGFVYRNNIAPDNGYGVVGSGDPRLTLSTYLPGAVLVGNVIAGADAADYPAGNFFPASLDDIGFADLAGGDYRLAATSPYRAAGVDGKNPGVDRDLLLGATGGVIAGSVTPTTLAAAAILPIGRVGQLGRTITVFGVVIAGGEAAVGCGVAPVTPVPASFTYQTTDPATNQATGTENTPADIPAGGIQTFVLAFTPTAPFPVTVVQFRFFCSNTPNAVLSIPAVNTLFLSASSVPSADIIALSATVAGDGIVTIPGLTGTGFFSVATVNVGAGAQITASVDTGGAAIPVSLAVCQTNSATGQCTSALGSTVATPISGGETPTFAIFVGGHGEVAFDPGVSRVFVRFTTDSGEIVGATSVAVRTR